MERKGGTWVTVKDSTGYRVGVYKIKNKQSSNIQEEISFVRNFLINMSKQREQVNLVRIAGRIVQIEETDKNLNLKVDVGMQLAIPMSIYTGGSGFGQKQVAQQLLAFEEGDYIQVAATARPWKSKSTDYVGVNLDIVQIMNKPPEKEERRPVNRKAQQREEERQEDFKAFDDDVPF